MYKQLAVSLALLAGAAVAANGQTTADATVQANVTANLLIAVTGVTDFGTIGNSGETQTIVPSAPAAGSTAAMFTATGTPNASISTTWTDINLTDPVSGATMLFTPAVSFLTTNNQATSASITDGATGTLSSTGNGFFWLGGNLTVSPSQTPGSYSGIFTLTVTYN
jgi:hypothetical protein